jgi:hypothetical protein
MWWTLAILIAGSLGVLTVGVLGSLLVAGSVYTIVRGVRRHSSLRIGKLDAWPSAWKAAVPIATCALLLGTLYFSLLGALLPEVQFDARIYHLSEAKRYAQHERIYNLAVAEGRPEAAFQQNQELLYAGAYRLYGMHAAKAMSWMMLLLAVVAIVGVGIEFFGSVSAGLLAALLFAATPIVAWSGSTAQNDLALAPFTLLAVYGFWRWTQTRRWGWIAMAGLTTGYAFEIKGFAGATGVTLAIFILAFARRDARAAVRALGVLVAGIVAGALPGAIRAAHDTGDPLFPIGASAMHSALWSPQMDVIVRSAYTIFGATTSWTAFPWMPWLLTMRPDEYRNLIGPFFLFALPVLIGYAVWRGANPLVRQLLAFSALWAILWFASGAVEARYAMAIFPLYALAAAYLALSTEPRPLARWAQRTFALLLLCTALLDAQPVVAFERGADLGYVMGRIPYAWSYLYGTQPESDVQLVYVPMLEWTNAHLDPSRDRIYAANDVMLFNVYSDVELYDGATPWALHRWTLASPDAYERLKEAGVDYVVVDRAQEPSLKSAALYAHLEEMHATPPSPLHADDPGHGQILYRIR